MTERAGRIMKRLHITGPESQEILPVIKRRGIIHPQDLPHIMLILSLVPTEQIRPDPSADSVQLAFDAVVIGPLVSLFRTDGDGLRIVDPIKVQRDGNMQECPLLLQQVIQVPVHSCLQGRIDARRLSISAALEGNKMRDQLLPVNQEIGLLRNRADEIPDRHLRRPVSGIAVACGIDQAALRVLRMGLRHRLQRFRQQSVIRIQEAAQLPGRQFGAATLRIAAASVYIVVVYLEAAVVRILFIDCPGIVRGFVVHQDDLPVAIGLCKDAVDGFLEIVAIIVIRNEY